MNAKEFHEKHGRRVVDRFREKIGMSLMYWYNIKNGKVGVSSEKALLMALASDEVTAGDGMQVVDLLRLRDLPARIVGTGKVEA